MDRAKTAAQMTRITAASLALKASRLCCRGVLRGRLALLGLIHQRGDLAQLRVHAGAGDQHRGPAIGDQGAGEDHVLLVAQGHLAGGDGLGGLLHALALSGEGAFVDLQGEILQDAPVGHDHVAGLQQDDIAGDDLRRGNLELGAAPQHLGVGRGHGLEALQGFFRLDILHRAQHRVENQHGEDDDGAFHVARQRRNHGGDHQNDHQQVFELLQKHLNRGFLLAFGELIAAIPFPAALHLLVGETCGGSLLLGQRLLGRFAVVRLRHRVFLPFWRE